MRWERLFADLEAQLAAAEAAAEESEVADRSRREAATLSLVDRLRASVGAPVQVRVGGAGVVEGVLREVGSQWLLLAEPAGTEALVPAAGVMAVSGLSTWSAAPGSAGPLFTRLGIGSALRAVARDRSAVTVTLADGSALSGTLDRVGADFVEVSAHAPGEPRRAGAVHGVRTVPVAAIAVLRRAG